MKLVFKRFQGLNNLWEVSSVHRFTEAPHFSPGHSLPLLQKSKDTSELYSQMCGLKLYTDRMLQLNGIAERIYSGGISYTNKIDLFTGINKISAVGEEALISSVLDSRW